MRQHSSVRIFRAAPIALAASLLSCAYTTIEQASCPTSGTLLTYQNFGEAFMLHNCQSCHGSGSLNRFGAPGEFIFDNLAQVQRHKSRIYIRAAGDNDSMPPGPDDPSVTDRHQLAEWLACGAP